MVEPTVEYGYRDLEIIQEHRQQHLDPDFAFGTNDLRIPLRLYQLRRAAGTHAALNAALEGLFEAIVRGDLADARLRLERAESMADAQKATGAISGPR